MRSCFLPSEPTGSVVVVGVVVAASTAARREFSGADVVVDGVSDDDAQPRSALVAARWTPRAPVGSVDPRFAVSASRVRLPMPPLRERR